MKKLLMVFVIATTMLVWSGMVLAEFEFNQQGDNQEDSLGYYYVITGGLFPTGSSPNGKNSSGGTFRYLLDDPDWGGYPLNQWNKDGWFPENAGLAVTLMHDETTVYDNNGIEDGSGEALYDYSDSLDYFPLLYRGYSMVNNFDWIYATYLKLDNETTFDTIIGYFDPTAGFDPYSPYIGYHMSIWSAYQDMPDTRPTSWMPAVASFTGDVFDSLSSAGTFIVEDTGINRVFPSGWGWDPDPIWRLIYKLDHPVTLPAGVYFFSHNAVILDEIIFGECNTDIMVVSSDAQYLSSSLEGCASEVKNHGQYMKCVSGVLTDAVKDGILTGDQKGDIESCAAKSGIGKKK